MAKYGRLDEKGYLVFPIEFLKDLENEMVITRGLGHCLLLYTNNEWQKLTEKLQRLSIDARALERLIISGAIDVKIDVKIDKGRILIPGYLKEYASLEKGKVIIVKIKSHFQIWNEEIWEKMKKEKAEIENLKKGIDILWEKRGRKKCKRGRRGDIK